MRCRDATPRRLPRSRMNLHVGVLHYTPSCEPFPLLADPEHYEPNTLDMGVDNAFPVDQYRRGWARALILYWMFPLTGHSGVAVRPLSTRVSQCGSAEPHADQIASTSVQRQCVTM